MELSEIQSLIKLVAKSAVNEVNIETKDIKLSIKVNEPGLAGGELGHGEALSAERASVCRAGSTNLGEGRLSVLPGDLRSGKSVQRPNVRR